MEDKNFDGFAITNKETGEIVVETNPGDKIKIITAKQLDYLTDPGREFNKGKSFVKLYDEVIPDLVEHLSGTELKYVISMAQHVSYKDCVLRKTNNNLSEPISASEFCKKIHGYNYESGRKIFNSLKKKGVIAYIEVGTVFPDYIGRVDKMYLVNPYIYFRGSDINDTVKTIFDESGWKEKLIN